ncbi:uncharacterized protein LOC110345307 isoform X2 [Heterocephalus glaber]|uniref:Uncharacterized protein LOC110345307 isoform X2 n=1 Tax=Heterocephalus glaber TaxID=10181 RepID=A0AAX6RNG0_HETGA|nr:uncharacterized protein LOC110345307 isoform X2 [Heterocephalus glaber]
MPRRLSVGSPGLRGGSPPSGGKGRQDLPSCGPEPRPGAALRRAVGWGWVPGRPGSGAGPLTCGGNSRSFPTWAEAAAASSPARWPCTGGHPAPSGTALARHEADTQRSAPPTTRRTRNRALAGPPLALLCTARRVLTAPAVLKATEPHFPVADFCPEARRCRLQAGSLTPRAGRQRAAAASTVPAASEARRCREGLGTSTSTWAAPELTPGMPAALPWGAPTRAPQAEGGVGRGAVAGLSGRQPRCPVGPELGGLGRPALQRASAQPPPGPFLGFWKSATIGAWNLCIPKTRCSEGCEGQRERAYCQRPITQV